jgi:hypothetical protein
MRRSAFAFVIFAGAAACGGGEFLLAGGDAQGDDAGQTGDAPGGDALDFVEGNADGGDAIPPDASPAADADASDADARDGAHAPDVSADVVADASPLEDADASDDVAAPACNPATCSNVCGMGSSKCCTAQGLCRCTNAAGCW